MRRLLLGVCLLLLAGCGGAAGSSPSLTNTSTATHFKIGQQVKASGWVVMVKSVQTMAQISAPTDPPQPQPTTITAQSGDTFLILDVSLQNVTNSGQESNYSQFVLHTPDGKIYQSSGGTLPGTVAAGSATEGAIVYEVPATAKAFTLTFASGQDVAVTWDINV